MIWMLSRYEYHFSDHKRSDRIDPMLLGIAALGIKQENLKL